jgi:hypothetical protein
MDNNFTYIIIGLLIFIIFLIIGLSNYLRRITLSGMESAWSDGDLIRDDIQDLKMKLIILKMKLNKLIKYINQLLAKLN